MRRTLLLLCAVSLLGMTAVSARADWDPEQPRKWVQFPDLSTMGIDVNASMGATGEAYILADDFKCIETGLITGIHIWGSWWHDITPADNPRNVTFTLSIHADIPEEQSPTGFSMPGEVLWYRTFQPSEFTYRVWEQGINEGWMDPPEGYEFPGDHVCFQYNFFIDPSQAFLQTGTPDNPVIYWLDVQAVPGDQEARFGWKTSLDHWNDDAVWGQGQEPYSGSWYELIYPPGHEMQGQSIDLSFVIVGEDQPTDLDFGDAPDGVAAPGYPTYLANNGANHVIGGPWLGDANDAPDPELDGQPTADAKGDDNDGNDDEDGVQMPAFIQGGMSTINFQVSGGGGVVEAWIDWNGDQVWGAGEMILSALLADGAHAINAVTPAGSVVGQTFARFRISTAGTGAPDGAASDGEVEDYELYIEEQPQEWDFGDAPEIPGAGGYPTTLANNGARHLIGGPFFEDPAGGLPDNPDPEFDGQPDPNALGDDNDGNDDEDGVQIPVLVLGGTSTITVGVGGGGGVVEAWIDFNGDLIWQGAELVFAGMLPDGVHAINVTTPAGSIVGQTFARFRISSGGGLSPVGAAQDGEVEDYEVHIRQVQGYKWEQPPDLNDTGIDVNATNPYILADDFLCTETGHIIEIYVWGSWRDDYLPFNNPAMVDFTLSFHKDIPDSMSPNGYSMPGAVEWLHTFAAGDFTVELWQEQILEGWMNPPEDYFFPGDTMCWLYTFRIPEDEAFLQRGSEYDPKVYWLDVQAQPHDVEAWFGWKTSLAHWNDDAVWGQGLEPFFGPWRELIYPPNHEMTGQSIDLAFALVGVPVTDVGSETPGRAPEFGLGQNVPNPFNPATEIAYEIPAAGRVTLEVYDVAGRLVRTLVDADQSAGPHSAVWDGRDGEGRSMATGVYFYRLQSEGLEVTHKMLLLK